MTPETWTREFLNARELNYSDGRPLYRYRMSDEEYDNLRNTLATIIEMGGHRAFNVKRFEAALVIFIAEWWRRFYDGNFSYATIFEAINLTNNAPTAQQRSELVRAGLKFWKRDVRKINGRRRYLGTLACEGGLPLNQLHAQNNALAQLMTAVLKQHSQYGTAIDKGVEARLSTLPQFLQNSDIHAVLVDILGTVTEFTNRYNLATAANPVDTLSQSDPQWRTYFPFPLNDEQSESLLNQLIGTGSHVNRQPAEQPFSLIRELRFDHADEAHLHAELVTQKRLVIDDLGLPAELAAQLKQASRVAVSCLSNEGDERFWFNGLITEKNNTQVIACNAEVLKLNAADSLKEWQILLAIKGQILAKLDINGGQSLAADEPWTFRNDKPMTLLGAGSQRVKNESVYLICPSNSEVIPANDDTTIVTCGEHLGGTLLSASGELSIRVEEERFRIKTATQFSGVTYALSGRRLAYQSTPKLAYHGPLRPACFDGETGRLLPEYIDKIRLQYKLVGADHEWQRHPTQHNATYFVRAINPQGDTLFKRKVLLLDEHFDVTLVRGATHDRGGSYQFLGADNLQLDRSSPTVNTTETEQNGVKVVALTTESPAPPAYCELVLRHQTTAHCFTLKLPFPARGAKLIDEHDDVVAANSALSIDQLWGHRLLLFSEHQHNNHASIEFYINHSNNERLSFNEAITLGRTMTELRLSDWSERIKQLLSFANDIDTNVRINAFVGAQQVYTLDIGQFALDLIPDKERGQITVKQSSSATSDQLTELTLYATLMTDLERPPEVLSRVETQDDQRVFNFDCPAAGPWIIHQAPTEHYHATTTLTTRSLLWVQPGPNPKQERDYYEQQDYPTLESLADIPYEDIRQQKTADVLAKMANNLGHPSWSYLMNLFERMGHLPLTTIDIWPQVAENPQLLTALCAHQLTDIVDKLDTDFSIVWHAIPLTHWLQAYRNYSSYYGELFPEDAENATDVVIDGLNELAQLKPSLSFVISIIKHELAIAEVLEVTLARNDPMTLLNQIDGLANSALENFNVPGEHFLSPTFSAWLKDERALLNHEVINHFRQFNAVIENAEPNGQVAMLLLPALLARRCIYSNDSALTTPIKFDINKVIELNPSWFETAYAILAGVQYGLNAQEQNSHG